MLGSIAPLLVMVVVDLFVEKGWLVLALAGIDGVVRIVGWMRLIMA